MSLLEEGFMNLIYSDVMYILLPFLLVFAIVFGVFNKMKIFGDDSKKFSIVLGLVMGLLVVFQHYVKIGGESFDIVNIIMTSLPQVALVLVAIIMLFLILGIFGAKPTGKGNGIGGWIGVIALLVVLYIFGSSAGLNFWDLPWWLQDRSTWALVLVLLLFGLIIKYITGDDKKDDKKDRMKELGEFFFPEKEK